MGSIGVEGQDPNQRGIVPGAAGHALPFPEQRLDVAVGRRPPEHARRVDGSREGSDRDLRAAWSPRPVHVPRSQVVGPRFVGVAAGGARPADRLLDARDVIRVAREPERRRHVSTARA